MNKYTIGATYSKAKIDTANEIVPQNAAFRACPNETHRFDEREGTLSYYQLTKAIESGLLTTLDKTILGLVATFASACITTKVLNEMLTMMGVSFSTNMLESSLRRLHKHQLINFSGFYINNVRCAAMRIITLTQYGSNLAKTFGVLHRFNSLATASAEAFSIKSRAQTAHLISNYLKNGFVDEFEVRPVIVVDSASRKIVRPAASIRLCGEKIYFEVPRRHDGWLIDLIDKLHRYELTFEGKPMPTVIINGEDEAMNRVIASNLANENISLEIFYTHDLAMFGEQFKHSIYSFNQDGSKQLYELITPSDEAA